MFNVSKYRHRESSGQPPRPIKPLRDSFSQFGGKLSSKRLQRRIDSTQLTQTQREYVKQVMAKHDRYGSIGITRREFHEGLDEMAKNVRDPIKQKDIEIIKKKF